jgi:phosphatidylserine/phosphatidylglycerophosphate/cardiolipin synthase-like enzyme
MIWTGILRRNKAAGAKSRSRNIFKKVLIFLGLPAVILGALFFLSRELFYIYQNVPVRVIEPAKTLEVTEHFSGQVYFNDSLGTDDFSRLLVSNIDKAEKVIEIAMYSMDSQAIRDALYRAAGGGVAVNIIFDATHQENLKKFFVAKPENVKINFVSVGEAGYMHHKFLLLDRGGAGQKLFFSSYNFTYLQGKYDPSFILETDRPEIIAVFGEEFDRWDVKLGSSKETAAYNPFAARIKYPEGFLEIWFSPGTVENNIKNRMIGLLRNSTGNIKAMIWQMTDRDMAAELAAAAAREPVEIITDDYNWSKDWSVFPILAAQKGRQSLDNLRLTVDQKRNQEVEKYLGNNSFNSFLHHHLLIVDDQVAVFGTENWSSGGFFSNGESIMVTDIKSLVEAFEKSYQANYAANK